MTKKTIKGKKIKAKDDSQTRTWKIVTFTTLGVFVFSQLFSVTIEPRFNLSSLSPNRGITPNDSPTNDSQVNQNNLQSAVIPQDGVRLPIVWGDLGQRMVADGVIDKSKFTKLFQDNLSEEEMQILAGNYKGEIVMTQENSRFILDMLWAFGLANKNEILENGEMTDEKYGGDASNFASTGGWSLSTGNTMNHYSSHPYVVLTDQQQLIVDRVSSGIYRPCCGNSTHFPDCNHGMAMLGLLEMMAANNVSEDKMYEVALKVNSLWFPQTYIDLATYFKEQGQEWSDVDPKLVLGQQYSSGQGYAQTRQKIKSLPTPASGGGGCGV
jgi:hypothetical protein